MAGTGNIQKTVDLLNKGGVIAFSTDTVNGMAALYDNEDAINSIFRMKKRCKDKPFALFFSSKESVLKYFHNSKLLKMVIDEFLPGPLTVISKPKRRVNKLLLKDGFASFRIPEKKDVLLLLELLKKPLAVTSLNVSGERVLTSEYGVEKVFDSISIFNKLKPSKTPSTIVKIKNGKIEILREGAISKAVFFERINKHLK
ncbi:MAG: L-threonylcarbamoyladenylate synthase [bacterium]